MSVLTAFATIAGVIPSLLGKKKFVLWYKDLVGIWIIKTKAISYRQCRKTKTALVREWGFLGQLRERSESVFFES